MLYEVITIKEVYYTMSDIEKVEQTEVTAEEKVAEESMPTEENKAEAAESTPVAAEPAVEVTEKEQPQEAAPATVITSYSIHYTKLYDGQRPR